MPLDIYRLSDSFLEELLPTVYLPMGLANDLRGNMAKRLSRGDIRAIFEQKAALLGVVDGEKLRAIKFVREITGWLLKDSKEYVEFQACDCVTEISLVDFIERLKDKFTYDAHVSAPVNAQRWNGNEYSEYLGRYIQEVVTKDELLAVMDSSGNKGGFTYKNFKLDRLLNALSKLYSQS